LVEGIDIDALARAVRHCPSVDDLDGGPLGGMATYLPGRRVPGVNIGDVIEIQVRSVWGVPAVEVARQIRTATAALVRQRRVDVVVSDITDPAVAALPPAVPAVH
jgi:hypothetical protein